MRPEEEAVQPIPEEEEFKSEGEEFKEQREEGINFFFSPIPDLDREYNQLINEILLSQRKKKLAEGTCS